MSGYVAKLSAGVLLAVMATAGPAMATEKTESSSVGTGWTVMDAGPPNYPNYDPQYEVTRPVEQWDGVDATSIALGALGGVALGGLALGLMSRRHGWRTVPGPVR
jgi:hypothetical protein